MIKGTKKLLAIVLRIFGGIDLLAFIAVMMPTAWIAAAHSWARLGEFPAGLLVGYLTRSASALYALHGLFVVYLSFDVVRYWKLIRVFAVMALLHGLIMFAIDVVEGMPLAWTIIEGPSFASRGVILLIVQAYASASE